MSGVWLQLIRVSLLAYLAFLLLLGVIAQWSAWRLKLPSILLLLIFGFGLSYFTGTRIDDYLANESSLLSLVGFFVAIILFEGGLTLKFSELKEAGTPVLKLCTTAVVIAFGHLRWPARIPLGSYRRFRALIHIPDPPAPSRMPDVVLVWTKKT